MPSATPVPRVEDLLRKSPKNWGRWGPDDEVGALNFLTPTEALRGIQSVRQGRAFTLQIPINHPNGDPAWPGRAPARKFNTMDKGHYACGKGAPCAGGAEHVDDVLIMHLQGSTQYDALGHFWCDDELWNGFPAATTAGTMTKASVLPIAERGIVGRGILIDIARHRGKPVLEKGETFTHHDLVEAAERQGSSIEKHDVLVVRTGWIGSYYVRDKREFYEHFVEPGLTYSADLVSWFKDMEIPNLVTDTMANEVTIDPVSGIALPLHIALMRNLGIAMTEMAQLDDLASSCAEDGQYTFLYAAAPLKVCGGSGSPVNPIVIK